MKMKQLSFILQADQRVLRQLITSYLPDTDLVLKEHDIGKIDKSELGLD
jgi:hypothetical protein